MSLNDALATYESTRRALDEFRAEFGPVLETHGQLEGDLRLAQDALTDAMATRNIDFVEDDSFAVTLIQQDRGEFVPDRLPDWVRQVPGVVRAAADTRKVQALVKAGSLSDEEAKAAWESKPAKPYVKVTIKTAGGTR